MTSGGISNWKGTDYEIDLVVESLLLVLTGRLRSVTWQHRDHGDGLDLSLEDKDGVIGVQAKSGTSQGNWTLRRLDAEGVSVAMHDFLNADPYRRFRLHAESPAPELKLLATQARERDAVSWQATWASDKKKTGFIQKVGSADLAIAHEVFRRIEVETQDHDGLKRHVSDLAVEHSPTSERLIALLRRVVESKVPKILRRNDLLQALQELDPACIVEIAEMPSETRECIQKRRQRFIDRVGAVRGLPQLKRDDVLPVLRKALFDFQATGGVIALHGPGGCGKSETLVQILQEMPTEAPVVVLSIADTDLYDTPSTDALSRLLRLLKRDCDRCPSSHTSLRPLLVVDQLDQALWAEAAILARVQRVLEQAQDLTATILVACRTADIQDERLAAWMRRRGSAGFREIPLGDLPLRNVEQTLIDHGTSPVGWDPKLLRLLCRPIALRLALALPDLTGIRRLDDLLNRWWAWVEGPGGATQDLPARDLRTLLMCLAEDSERNQRQDLSAHLGDRAGLQRLIAVGVLDWADSDQRRVRWTHQILLDHLLARRWWERVC